MPDMPETFVAQPDAVQVIHHATSQILQYFAYAHLPEHLQAIARPVCELAWEMARTLPQGPEVTVGLRKLLEAKDCFVRARL